MSEDVIIPIEKVQEELDKEESEEKVDLSKINVQKILGIIPIEPVIIMAIIDGKNGGNISDIQTIGIPGFLNTSNDSFYLLDGSSANSESLNNAIKEFLKNGKNK